MASEEEDKLLAKLNKRQDQAFELHRQQSIKDYEKKAGKAVNLQLTPSEAPPKVITSPRSHDSPAAYASTAPIISPRAADPSLGRSLAAHEERLTENDRQLRRLHEDESRRKLAEVQATGSAHLSAYEAKLSAADRELRARLEAEEQRKREELAALDAKRAAAAGKADAADEALRKKLQEEAERKRQDIAAIDAKRGIHAGAADKYDAEVRARLVEEEKRKQEDLLAISAKRGIHAAAADKARWAVRG